MKRKRMEGTVETQERGECQEGRREVDAGKDGDLEKMGSSKVYGQHLLKGNCRRSGSG